MFKRKRGADDFAEEIQAHLELEADELKREGLSDEEAHRKARIEFGNLRAAQERFYLRSRAVATFAMAFVDCGEIPALPRLRYSRLP